LLIEKTGSEHYMLCRIPGIVITQTGTFLAYYECRKSLSDWAEIDIKITRSTDGGETWQIVTIFSGDGNTLNNPVMFVNGEELHFLFLKNYKNLYHCVSTDDGQTFSIAQEKFFDCDFFYNVVAVGPGHGIVHNGNMIVPVWFAQNKEQPKAHAPSIISTLYSADGENWKLGETIGSNVLVNPSECALAVTKDNKVLISIRNENDCHQRAFAISDDGFSHWKELHFHPQMSDPICMGSMYSENETIYHINCDSTVSRENLTVKKSQDCFKTFESFYIDSPAGYSDITVKNGIIYVLYEKFSTDIEFNKKSGGLYFKKITFK